MKNFLTTIGVLAMGATLTFAQNPQQSTKPEKSQSGSSSADMKSNKMPTKAEIDDARSRGMVWVNANGKTYYKDGSHYGKSKGGRFMTEDEAKAAGYSADMKGSKTPKTP